MAIFRAETLEIYSELKKLQIDMEFRGIVERFHMLTKLNRASMGLNYTRLFKKFLVWRKERIDLDLRKGGFDARLGVLDFVEHLIQKKCGS